MQEWKVALYNRAKLSTQTLQMIVMYNEILNKHSIKCIHDTQNSKKLFKILLLRAPQDFPSNYLETYSYFFKIQIKYLIK